MNANIRTLLAATAAFAKTLKMLAITCAAVATFVALADGETWQSRAPMHDAYVRDAVPNANYGTDGDLIVGNNREVTMLFDVSGLANVTAAKIKFYITQCGTAVGAKWPLFFRIMRNDRWNESTLTWNSLPDEFRVKEPIVATNDVSLAGYVEVLAGSQDTWQEVDVTEAVKAAAPRGRLALHVYTYWDGASGDFTPLCVASVDCSDETKRPVLEFQGAVDSSAASLTLFPTDDVFIEAGHPSINYGVSNAGNGGERYKSVLAQKSSREGFMKFDLSGIEADSVDSAVLLVRMNQTQANTGSTVQFQLTENTTWNEAEVTWNNAASTVGVAPNAAWPEETPANAVRIDSASPNQFYSIELAPLVNQVLTSGGTKMSLHITISDPVYFIFYSKEYENERWRPRLLVSPKVDASLTTRTPVQETFVGSSASGKNTAYFPWMQERNWDYLQIGCNGSMTQYGLMLFDTAGLENADYVCFRVLSRSSIAAGDGALRVAAWATDAWNATNLTWNTLSPFFPAQSVVTAETVIPGEIANIGLTQTKSSSYFEADVTEAVRAAAQSGKMVTFGLFSNRNWPEFYKGESSNPAVLIFPDPDAKFGSRVTCSLNLSGATPALQLKWSPSSVVNAAYTVERRKEDGTWKTVARGLSEETCLDAKAEPNVEHTYRITETTSGESVVKSVTLVPEVKVFACADTYVQNGGNANASFGSATALVHRYDGGDNSGGVREALYRFDLSEMPTDFESATLKLYLDEPAESFGSNAHFDLYKYPDFEWTDAAAPAWNEVFGNGWASPQAYSNHPDGKRPLETELGIYRCSEHGDLAVNVPVCFDVADAIRAAKTVEDTHITLHTFTYSSSGWNFGIVSRERSQGVSCAAQIEFTLKNWVGNQALVITLR